MSASTAVRTGRLAWARAGLGGCLLLALAACAAPEPAAPAVTTFGGHVMGTTWAARVAEPLDGELSDEAERAVARELREVDDLMTTYRDSEVTRFNTRRDTRPFAFSPANLEVIRLSLELARRTEGALDITVGPLVEALGFGPPRNGAPVTETELEALRSWTGWRLLTVLPGGGVVKAAPDLEIDLSAVAKGYGVDRAAAALEELGLTRYMVEVGGEVRARGHNERGEVWRIGIERPDTPRRTVQRIVPLADLAMATSGDYRNYREVDGRRISHIVDPRTGRSIDHRVASATVLHEECATADGLATAMMVLGEEGLALAEANGWAVLLLVRDGQEFEERASSAFDRLVGSTAATATAQPATTSSSPI